MKKRLVVTAALLSAAAILTTSLTSCSTTSEGKIVVAGQVLEPAQVAKDVAFFTDIGARALIRKDANAKAYLQAADAVLTAAVDAGSYDPKTLEASLKTMSVKEINGSPTIADAIAIGLHIYANHYGGVTNGKLDQTIYLKPVLLALRDGIRSATTSQ